VGTTWGGGDGGIEDRIGVYEEISVEQTREVASELFGDILWWEDSDSNRDSVARTSAVRPQGERLLDSYLFAGAPPPESL
jgi:hypothetical protein